ncbi:unnamed protein product [Linum trigynum]|uniref:Uncharacterized protein n=1 Tax=Linum trigynum TaxID=586398 RepID=A0AAV2DSA4_9ROSI
MPRKEKEHTKRTVRNILYAGAPTTQRSAGTRRAEPPTRELTGGIHRTPPGGGQLLGMWLGPSRASKTAEWRQEDDRQCQMYRAASFYLTVRSRPGRRRFALPKTTAVLSLTQAGVVLSYLRQGRKIVSMAPQSTKERSCRVSGPRNDYGLKAWPKPPDTRCSLIALNTHYCNVL